jgi:hypothetical protein
MRLPLLVRRPLELEEERQRLAVDEGSTCERYTPPIPVDGSIQ